MKKIFMIVSFVVGISFLTHAQVVSEAEHKIIYQLVDGNSEVHDKFLRQLENVLEAAPNSQIEVVVHGMGVDLMRNDTNTQSQRIKALIDGGVTIVVCENTLKQRNLKKEQFLEFAGFVPTGILEIVMKQEQGWIYIKAGI